ncbi:MAG: YdcF family protein [Flavobacteriales bacterium]
MKRKFKIVLALFSLIFLIQTIYIIADGLIDDKILVPQVAVILGSKVNEDGSLSERLKARLDCGLKLYADGLFKAIYVSGGLGKEGYEEGTVMAKYLMDNGVPKYSIKIDNQGRNTRNTAVNFKKDFPLETSVILVTQYFHISRCKFAFKQVGVQNVAGVHCNLFEWRDPYSILREIAGFYKYLIYY